MGDVSELSGMGQANASSLCKKLEKEGFLTRRRSCPDRRVVTLSLAPKGREAMTHIQGRLDHYLALANARSAEEREELAKWLTESGCEMIAIESTGGWKALPGRKTDVKDAAKAGSAYGGHRGHHNTAAEETPGPDHRPH